MLFKLMEVTLKIGSLFHICYVHVLEKENKLDLAYNDAGKFPVIIRKGHQNPYSNSWQGWGGVLALRGSCY